MDPVINSQEEINKFSFMNGEGERERERYSPNSRLLHFFLDFLVFFEELNADLSVGIPLVGTELLLEAWKLDDEEIVISRY